MPKKSRQSEPIAQLDTKLSLDGRRFFPIGINLTGRRVLIAGEGGELNQQIVAVVEFGAQVDVLAKICDSELKELAVTLGHRVRLLSESRDDLLSGRVDLKPYFMVFAWFGGEEDNANLAKLSRSAGALTTERFLKKDSDFAVPTWFRRGQIKISVATDGISNALERAFITRIKAAFVREMDHYALFADFVIEKLTDASAELKDDLRLSFVIKRLLDKEEISLALQRNNFDEASHLFEHELTELIEEVAARSN